MIKLDIQQAIQILDALGSSNDPIVFRGKETSPNTLSYDFSIEDSEPASKIRIKFWTDNGKQITGSLITMVAERLGLKIKQREVKSRRKELKKYSLYEWGMHGSGIFHPKVINEIQVLTGVEFMFSSEAFVDYAQLADEIYSQLLENNIDCSISTEDDVIIKIII